MTIKVKGMISQRSTSEEIKRLKDTCKVIAEWNIAGEYLANGGIPLSQSSYDKQVEDETDRLILLSRNHQDDFADNVRKYLEDPGTHETPVFFELMKSMQLVTAHGKISKTAPREVAKKFQSISGKTSLKSLGVEFERPAETGLRKMISAVTPRQRINLNTMLTPDVSKVSVIDKKLFRESEMYRAEMIAEANSYKKMGSSASKIQKQFVREIDNLVKNEQYSLHFEDRLSPSEKAFYMATKATANLLGKVGGGLGSIALSGLKMTGKGISKTPSVISSGVKALFAPNPYKKEAVNVEEEFVPATVVPPSVEPTPSVSTSKKQAKFAPPENRFSQSIVSGARPSYKMQAEEGDSATIEERDEQEDEDREKNYEFEEEKITLLKQIDDDIKKISSKDDSSLMTVLGGIGTALAGLGGLAAAIKGLSKFTSTIGSVVSTLGSIGKMAMRFAGPIGIVAGVGTAAYKAYEAYQDWDESNTRMEEDQANRKSIAEQKRQQIKDLLMKTHGVSEEAANASLSQYDAHTDMQKYDTIIKQLSPVSYEPVSPEKKSDKIEESFKQAEEVKEEKRVAKMTEAMGPMIANHISQNSVIAPTQNSQSTTRTSPVNPDNSYLTVMTATYSNPELIRILGGK